jgi:ubiquinone/menaquinone biosynthesis C-methylase UbiE
MIDIAKQSLPSAEFRQGNGEAMPYESASVDVAIATGIMHHADHPSLVISEMFRVARKGVLISDHNNYAFSGSLAR